MHPEPAGSKQPVAPVAQDAGEMQAQARPVTQGPARASLHSQTWKQHDFQHLLRSQSTSPLDSGTRSHVLALLQYTPGTTATPKGVMISLTNLAANVAQVA